MTNSYGKNFIPNAIVVHCSASDWGDARAIREWHIERGWSDAGYHAVILNGHRAHSSAYARVLDGKIEPGRPEYIQGAHCKADNMNSHSLGVCLVGNPDSDSYPSIRQIAALIRWLAVKCREYGISPKSITQHSDHEPAKPFCASVNIYEIRKNVSKRLSKM